MKWFTFSVLFFIAFSLHAQDLHFHETHGFGTTSNYGLNGTVYRVTNLNNSGEGSLRSAIEFDGARIIVFEVGGIIDLDGDDITVKNGSITIAGQTAPYPGITLIKGGLKVRANNVLVQHITIRPGDAGYTQSVGWEPDGFNVTTSNVVFDHCSVSWSIDENMSVSRGGKNLTFYRCIVAEGLSNSIHSKGEHSCGTLVMDNSTNISIIGSLYAHNFRRHPRLKDGTEVTYANNVVYNYGIYAAHIGGEQGDGYAANPGVGNFIGNAFFKGLDGWDNYMVEGHKGDFDKDMNPGNGEAYLNDNIMLDRMSGDPLIANDEHITLLAEAHNLPDGYNAFSAYENIEKVLRNAGSRPFERSNEDARIVQSLIDGTGKIINSQEEVGSYPEYTATNRSIKNVPESIDERRLWLDSISSTLATNKALNVAPLYAFIDAYKLTSALVEPNENYELSAYPNPVKDRLSIEFSIQKATTINLLLINALGQVTPIIHQQTYADGTHRLNVDLNNYALKSGIYNLILMQNGKNKSITLSIE